MTAIDKDHHHMTHALALAERGLFTTQPNPRVGCVIVRDGEMVGEGWHRKAGEPHAEVFALRAAGGKARGATAYVTLEPCSHQGRTPPCADALIEAGVARVVIASTDPNPEATGGVDKLRAAGITVETGLMREQARELNIGFFSRLERGRPWVRVKLAMSLDGRTALANGVSKWITGESARADVQRWRARSSAILTGSGTVLADDPRLTVRLNEPFEPPLRVVLDRQLRTPAGVHVLDDSAPTLLVHADSPDVSVSRAAEIEHLCIDEQDGRLDIHALLVHLASRGCNEVHVEAGPTLCGALVEAGLIDELLLYMAPVVLGDKARPLLTLPLLTDMRQRRQFEMCDQRMLGSDTRLRLRPVAGHQR